MDNTHVRGRDFMVVLLLLLLDCLILFTDVWIHSALYTQQQMCCTYNSADFSSRGNLCMLIGQFVVLLPACACRSSVGALHSTGGRPTSCTTDAKSFVGGGKGGCRDGRMHEGRTYGITLHCVAKSHATDAYQHSTTTTNFAYILHLLPSDLTHGYPSFYYYHQVSARFRWSPKGRIWGRWSWVWQWKLLYFRICQIAMEGKSTFRFAPKLLKTINLCRIISSRIFIFWSKTISLGCSYGRVEQQKVSILIEKIKTHEDIYC